MRQTVLIADGDEELCNLYGRFLGERGYAVETSPDGLDCMRKLRQLMPSALVLDLELHWGGGDGVLAWLREENPGHAIPVILTATAGYSQHPIQSLELPVVDFLPKPFTLKTLLDRVGSAIAKDQQRDSASSQQITICSEHFIG